MNTVQPPVPTNTAPSAVATEDKTAAILSYLTIIGFIVGLVIHNGNKTRLGAFHLRQSLGLFITSLVLIPLSFGLAFIPVLGWLTELALWFGLFALWIIGLISAANGQQKPVPVIGEKFQSWLGQAFE
jgi:uncharacterized membrane protein